MQMIQREWLIPEPVTVPDELIALTGGQRLAAEILVRRGITDVAAARAFLDPDAYIPASPYDLPGMPTAVQRLQRAMRDDERVLVWGDFDVDGQTATTLLVSALRACGLEVRFYIPDRHTEGHGIQAEKLLSLVRDGIRLVVTCDTGIAEVEAVRQTQATGVDVIITDHHRLPEQLPPALACVNPQMVPPEHPLHPLPGVGCAYKLIEALFTATGRESLLPGYLDLVAIGTVADVAALTGEARYLVQRGLEALRQTRRSGLLALMQTAKLTPDRLDEESIAFQIAPRLNALGRLGDANEAVEFLTTDDDERAKILAYRLEGLNNERRLLTRQILSSARQQVEQNPGLLDYRVLVLSHAQWAGGVLGIVASQLVEEFHRPVVLLRTPPDEMAHGSARSSGQYDITAAIARCADLLAGYGGHTLAAGVTLAEANIPEFRRRLSRTIGEQVSLQHAVEPLRIDAEIPLSAATLDLVSSIRRLAPFGAGNPAIHWLMRGVQLVKRESFGSQREHVRLVLADGTGQKLEVIRWREGDGSQPDDDLLMPEDSQWEAVITLRERVYQGRQELQAEYVDLRPVEPDQVYSPAAMDIVDYRGESDPITRLRQTQADFPDALLWDEGLRLTVGGAHPRHDLQRAEVLIVWTIPASAAVWREVLTRVRPERVILFAQPAAALTIEEVGRQVAGLAKYALRQYDGWLDLQVAAGLIGLTRQVIEKCLDWLSAQGVFRIVKKENDRVFLEPVLEPLQNQPNGDVERLYRQVGRMLEEVSAYRTYLRTAQADTWRMSGSEQPNMPD